MRTTIVAAGKRFLGVAGLAAALSCASIPAYVPPDDYEQYPQYKKESALYKIGRIFEQNCEVMKFTGPEKKYEVSPARISCVQEHCTAIMAGPQADPSRPGNMTYVKDCVSREPLEFSLLWSEVVSPRLVGCEEGGLNCLKFSSLDREHDFHAFNPTQAEGLKRAMEVYLQER